MRNVNNDTETPLSVYEALQTPRNMDEGLLRRLLKGLATRNYEACAETVPETFGLSSSTVSRRYVKATARKLAQFQERSLASHDVVALFLDGKSFADEQIIIALGVTLDGQKIPLGFVQAATENERVCRAFLAELVDRGLQYDAGLLVVIGVVSSMFGMVLALTLWARVLAKDVRATSDVLTGEEHVLWGGVVVTHLLLLSVYGLTPYDVRWHLGTSLSRLLVLPVLLLAGLGVCAVEKVLGYQGNRPPSEPVGK